MLSLDEQNRLRERYRRLRPTWRPATEIYADLVRARLRPDTRVLDIGCGRGGLVEQLDYPPQQIVGIDPDLPSLREHRLPALPRTAALSDDLPFAGDTFDLAFASWILEHLPQPLQTLREIRRVLQPGGVFVFITPNGRHPLTLLNRWFGRVGAWQGRVVERVYGRGSVDTFPTTYRANDPATLRHLSQQAGLLPVTLYTVPDPTYLALRPALLQPLIALEDALPADRHIHLVGVLLKPAP